MHTSLQGQQAQANVLYWYFEKGSKQQSFTKIQGWTLNLNWTDQKVETN